MLACAHTGLWIMLALHLSLAFSFRNTDLPLPSGLRLFNPQKDIVLASIVGAKASMARAGPEETAAAAGATPAAAAQPSASQLEKEKKEKERKEEEEMVAQKMAQKGAKGGKK